MNQSRTLLRLSLAANVVLAASLALLIVSSNAPAVFGGYTVVVSKGLEMRMTADEAAAVASDLIDRNAQGAAAMGLDTASAPKRIISVIGATGGEVGDFEPRAAGVIDVNAKVWIIRAEGPFLANRGLGGPRLFKSGYIVLDDASGDVIARGMP